MPSMPLLEQLLASAPVLLLIALMFEYRFPISDKWHPLTPFKNIANYLANKVNRGSNYQQYISGFLLTVTLLTVVMTVFESLRFISLFPTLFDLLVLILCLRGGMAWRNWNNIVTLFQQAEQQPFKEFDNYQECKRLLAPLLLRKVDTLSPYGLQKATVEGLSQRLVSHWFGVILFFLLFGIHLTLLYVLAIELAQQFNVKQHKHRLFGFFPNRLSRLFTALPLLVVSLFLLLYGPIKSSFLFAVNIGKEWHFWNSGFLLAVISAGANQPLGGPRLYPVDKADVANELSNKHRSPTIYMQNKQDPKKVNIEIFKISLNRLRYTAQLWVLLTLAWAIITYAIE